MDMKVEEKYFKMAFGLGDSGVLDLVLGGRLEWRDSVLGFEVS